MTRGTERLWTTMSDALAPWRRVPYCWNFKEIQARLFEDEDLW